MDVGEFKKLPIIGILRGTHPDVIEPLVESIVSAGLKTIEITMNTPNAPEIIRKVVTAARGRLTVGAGTVLTTDNLRDALKAGATFIVSPVFIPNIVEYCVKGEIPVFPGALTPQEIYNAWEGGATMVKVFPARFFGPTYLKEIKGPLEKIELLACSGVTANNIEDFFTCGASAVAFGGSIFKKEWLASGSFSEIENATRELVDKVKKASQN